MSPRRHPVRWARERFSTLRAYVGLRLRRRVGSSPKKYTDRKIVISLTTYPARAGLVHHVVNSLLLQSVRADEVVLVLAVTQFAEVPANLAAISDPRFSVEWVDRDTRSYKKLIPTLDLRPDCLVITTDDDVIYPRIWLRQLLAAHKAFPDSVICGRGQLMGKHAAGGFTPYREWRLAVVDDDPRLILPTGIGGVLYPPGCLDERVRDMERALTLCPTADDIWFKIMAFLAGTDARLARSGKGYLPAVNLRGDPGLTAQNVGGGGNDFQLAAAWAYFGLS